VDGREGGGGDSPAGRLVAELYIVLEVLSFFRRALNFSLPVRLSIISRESSSSSGGGAPLGRGGGGVADIFFSLELVLIKKLDHVMPNWVVRLEFKWLVVRRNET